MTSERWLPISGTDGRYEVSDRGRVRSRPMWRGKRHYPGRLLARWVSKGNHRSVTLSIDGERSHRQVHRLVLEAFVGPCPDGLEGCHNDNDPANNALANLRWDTRSSNILDRVEAGAHNNARKEVCPYGHALEAPNLVLADFRQGRRKCWSCTRARAWAKYHGTEFDPAVADRYYQGRTR